MEIFKGVPRHEHLRRVHGSRTKRNLSGRKKNTLRLAPYRISKVKNIEI